MRIKNDVLIKYYLLYNTRNDLTDRQFRLTINYAMILQDVKKIRYEDLPPEAVRERERIDEKTVQDYLKEYNENEKARDAMNAILEQALKSKRKFEELQERHEKKEIPDDNRTAEDCKEKSEKETEPQAQPVEYWSVQDLTEEDFEGADDELSRLFKKYISNFPKTMPKFDALCDIFEHEREYIEQEYMESLEANIPNNEDELPFS